MQGGLFITLGIVAAVVIAMFFIEAGVFGYLKRPASWPERILFLAGGGFLMKFSLRTVIIGLICLTIATISQFFMPNIPIIGKRPAERTPVDLSKIKWDKKDTERLLVKMDPDADV